MHELNPQPIRIVSKRKGGTEPARGEIVIDVDRLNPVLGNRHVLLDHRDDAERARVIEAYRKDFEADVARSGPMLAAASSLATRVQRGERIALRCWCAPKPCHAEIIRAKVHALAGLSLSTSIESGAEPAPVPRLNLF